MLLSFFWGFCFLFAFNRLNFGKSPLLFATTRVTKFLYFSKKNYTFSVIENRFIISILKTIIKKNIIYNQTVTHKKFWKLYKIKTKKSNIYRMLIKCNKKYNKIYLMKNNLFILILVYNLKFRLRNFKQL